MGPAILLTLGFQFLLDSMGVIRFGRTLPILLVVIGLVKIFQSTAGPGPLPSPLNLECRCRELLVKCRPRRTRM